MLKQGLLVMVVNNKNSKIPARSIGIVKNPYEDLKTCRQFVWHLINKRSVESFSQFLYIEWFDKSLRNGFYHQGRFTEVTTHANANAKAHGRTKA